MKDDKKYRGALRLASRYFGFFMIVAFVITCGLLLFLNTLSESLGIEFTSENISKAAKLTLINVLFISLVLTIIDTLRRKFTVERPVKEITRAAEKMIHGDFSVRINYKPWLTEDDGWADIADCINKMAEELSGVETLRTDFIANVSHEMKTPLSVIQNYATLIMTDGIADEQRNEYARAITAATKRLSDMVTNILKLNRLENQTIYPNAERFELGEQLAECLLEHEGTWERKNIEIDTDIEGGVFVLADRELLSLVWSNLFSNAFKFTENGGRVSVSLAVSDGYAVVKVADTGVGMPAEVGAHIFEKFYQADGSHKTDGNGLGLALVRRVIDITHADITVESEPERGTTFTVMIALG